MESDELISAARLSSNGKSGHFTDIQRERLGTLRSTFVCKGYRATFIRVYRYLTATLSIVRISPSLIKDNIPSFYRIILPTTWPRSQMTWNVITNFEYRFPPLTLIKSSVPAKQYLQHAQCAVRISMAYLHSPATVFCVIRVADFGPVTALVLRSAAWLVSDMEQRWDLMETA